MRSERPDAPGEVLDILAAALRTTDPMPERARRDALAAYQVGRRRAATSAGRLRRLGDQLLAGPTPVLRRSGSGVGARPVAFTGEGVTLSLDLDWAEGDLLRVVGFVTPSPGPGGGIRVLHPTGSVFVELDRDGRFTTEVPAGPLQVMLVRRDDRPLSTDWLVR
ncbi:hypothetical protein [Actinoalloteichus spitiensis]|uniref:hypothetical protein n=1 Tax=Actinoalloteichus spitiensis TaxID=252394 RepID=UPI000377AE4B|nr:hypothetical protein [Actinoalloteichus spitiensis]